MMRRSYVCVGVVGGSGKSAWVRGGAAGEGGCAHLDVAEDRDDEARGGRDGDGDVHVVAVHLRRRRRRRHRFAVGFRPSCRRAALRSHKCTPDTRGGSCDAPRASGHPPDGSRSGVGLRSREIAGDCWALAAHSPSSRS